MPRVPVRLQLSRVKGFNLQALSLATNGLAAVVVKRPTRWGNPYPVETLRRAHAQAHDWSARSSSPLYASWANSHFRDTPKAELASALDDLARRTAVALFAIEVAQFERSDAEGFRRWLAPLQGKNLACTCRIDQRCHADWLLALANGLPYRCEAVA